MRAAIVLALSCGCAAMPPVPKVWIPIADARPELNPQVDVRVPVEDLDHETATRADGPRVMLLPDCDAALHRSGPRDACTER